MSKTIQVFSNHGCVQCMMTKNLFKRNGVDYTEINVGDPENINHLEALKEAGHSALPVVRVIENDEIVDEWVGFRDDKIKSHS